MPLRSPKSESSSPMPARRTKISDVRYDNDIPLAPTVGEFVRGTDYTNVFWNCAHFRQCLWQDVRLHHSSMNRRSEFHETVFERCRFTGRHTHLGALFQSCTFKDCAFVGITFWDARLRDCVFQDCRIENMFFSGLEAPEGWRTRLERCDFSSCSFVDADFRLGIDTSSCSFPQGFDPHWLHPSSSGPTTP
jgi:uncharacterized protein YjbI with pentapeptide repeats